MLDRCMPIRIRHSEKNSAFSNCQIYKRKCLNCLKMKKTKEDILMPQSKVHILLCTNICIKDLLTVTSFLVFKYI